MIRFVLGCVLVLVAVGLWAAASAIKKEDKPAPPKWPAFAVLSVGALFCLWSFTRVVEANEVGVPSTFGRVGAPMQSGLHFTWPWTDVTEFSTRMQEMSLLLPERDNNGNPTSPDNSIKVIAKDGGEMRVGITVRWAVEKGAIDKNLYRQAGTLDLVQTRFVKPDAQEVVRNVYGQHAAEEGYSTGRAVLAAEITEALQSLGTPRGIIIDSVNIREVEPTKEVLDKISAIVTQRNQTLLAQETQKTALIEAETRRQQAEVDAAAQVLTAQGIADSQLISAEAEAQANQKLAASLTPELLNLQAIQACAEAISQTKAAVVTCGSATGGSGAAAPAASVIVDQRS